MSPGMTVVPRQSTTTSAASAPVLDPAPSAAIRPCSTRIASASSRGDARMPVASAPMFTRPRLAISPRRGERPPHSSTEGGYAPLGLPRPTPRTAHPRRLRRRVEHLVLELASAELGADEVPDELDELDPFARRGGGGPVVPLGVGASFLAREGGLRGRHGLKGAARQLAQRAHHVDDQPAL